MPLPHPPSVTAPPLQSGRVHPQRVHALKPGRPGSGPVVYWLSREQRHADNWALLHAQDLALERKAPLVCVFCLVRGFLAAGARHYDFMLRGLEELAGALDGRNIPLAILQGEPDETLPPLLQRLDAALLVTDFDPLRRKQQWVAAVCAAVPLPVLEVDGHNVVPCRVVSQKREVGARTLRPKLGRLLPEFLEPFPELRPHPHSLEAELRAALPRPGRAALWTWLAPSGPEPVNWLQPGEAAAQRALDQCLSLRLPRYATQRADPNAEAVSRLSPYFHFGQLAPQRAALAASAALGPQDPNVQAFLEELIVRRELSDNFCLHTPDYDSLEGAPDWGRKTLEQHRNDPRPYCYTLEQFAMAKTHSPLWNAAQQELLQSGYMHGYLRMYWAKKILEWSESPEEAVRIAVTLNDRLQLDGRDPNGYVGVLWSVAGLHDRAWQRRPVYGMIRYMNANGCRRKFDVGAYVARWLGGPRPPA